MAPERRAGVAHARQRTVSSDRRRVWAQICSERDRKQFMCGSVREQIGVRQSGTSASFPIMAAALLPGPSSPLLFFGKRELWRQERRREGLTQRRPHTTAAGRRAAASSSRLLQRRRSSLPTRLSVIYFPKPDTCTLSLAYVLPCVTEWRGKKCELKGGCLTVPVGNDANRGCN